MLGLGLRQTARALGISHVALLNAANEGRAPRLPDASFDLAAVRASEWLANRPAAEKPVPVPVAPRVMTPPQAPPPAPAQAAQPKRSGALGKLDGLTKLDIDKMLAAERQEKIRLDNEVRRKSLAPIAPLNAWAAGMIVRARDILLRIPTELRDRLAQEADPNRVEQILMKDITHALNQLAEYRDVA